MQRALTSASTEAHARQLLAAVQGVPAPGAPLHGDVEGIDAAGDRTLRLHLRSPESRLVVAALATPLTTPVPASREDVPPWTGPYAPELEGPDGDVVLRRNRGFRPLADDWRRAWADTVRLQADDGPGAASRVLSGSGLLLGSQGVPAVVARTAARRGELIRVVMPTTEYVAINPGALPFGSESLRQAAVAAIDREALLRLAGRDGLLASHWLPPGTPGHDQSGGAEGPRYDFLASPTGDDAVAADYLRRAGYPSGRYTGPPIVAMTAPDATSRTLGVAIRAQLALVGFRVVLRTAPAAVARTACSRPSSGVAICPDAVLSSPVRDPEALLRTGFGAQDLLARFGGDLSALMTLASEARPGEQRARAWGDINRDLLRAGAGAPWRWDRRDLLVSRDVRGVVDDGSGAWDLAASSLSAPG
jgi:peptide/nickel transport system substrate-binding protein